jgi:hypothetical protein
MSKMMRSFLGSTTLLLVLIASALGQTPDEFPSSSISAHIGYSLTLGDWNKHRFATDIDHFGGSIFYGGDLELKTSDKVGLALIGGYAKLDVSKWEDFAVARGDHVSASASVSYVGLVLRPYLKATKPAIIKLEFGPGLVFAKGHETFGRFSYDYDFIRSTSIGFLLGIEFNRFLNDNLALAAKITSMIVPSGIEYASGKNQTVIIMPVSVGMRFHL